MSPFAIAGALTALSSIGFGAFVYAQDPRRVLYRRWFAFTVSVALWGVGAAAIAAAPDPALAALAWRLAFGLGVVWIPVLFLDFTLTFCELPWKRVMTAANLSGLAFSAAALATPYFFAGVRPAFGAFYYGIPYWPVFSVFLIWWFGLVAYAHYLLVRAYPSSTEPKKLQIRYFFVATAIGFTTGMLAYLPFFHIDVYPWGTFGIVFYPILMSYAAVEHQLLDINWAFQKAFLSSAIVTVIALGLLGSGLASRWLSAAYGISPIVIAFAGAAVAFVLGDMVWRRFRRFERLRYEFITVAAHRLRTPITHIRWAASELEHAGSIEEARRAGKQIVESDNRLLDLVNAFLHSIEMSDSMFAYTLGPCDVAKLAQSVLESRRDAAERKGLRLALRSDLPEPLALADGKRLAYVIEILLDNAILYTPENGAIEIGISSHNNDYIMLSVHDSGIGIDEEERELLFTRLYRGRNAIGVYTEGTGLGLFMAKEIVERQGGMIGAESPGLGRGSTFWFIMPKAAGLSAPKEKRLRA